MKNLPDIPGGTNAPVRLLATSDLHMNLTGYDYYADRPDVSIGLTRTAGLIHAARNEAAKYGALTLLFDNGDALQGTPFGDMAVQTPDRLHPLMQSFKHLEYDAIGLGNHDFNFGLEPLLAILAKAPCPVVCSNLSGSDGQPLPGIKPHALLERMILVDGVQFPVRIGVMAFLPPQTVRWDAHLLQGKVRVGDIIGSARQHIAQLQQLDCDLIVALAHCGLDDGAAHDGMENAVLPLADLGAIDAIIAGHTHLHLPGRDHAGLRNVDARTGAVHGKPVVMPGCAGSHLGVIDLTLKPGGAKRWVVEGFKCALRPIVAKEAGGKLKQLSCQDHVLSGYLETGHADTRANLRQPVGYSDHAMHSYFSFLAPDRAAAQVAAAQASALRPLLAGTKAAGYPMLSATSPCKFGGRAGPFHYTDVPAGKVTMRHVADLYVFPNQLRAVIVNGQQVLAWLEKSAELFCRITPASTGMALIDPYVPGHDFDVLHGLTWQIDLSGAVSRVSNVRFGGTRIRPDQQFVVALNNYRASGGGNFICLKDAQHLTIPPLDIRDTLRDYLSGVLPVDPLEKSLPAWHFRSMPATTVSVQTGPGAVDYLDELSGRGISVSGPGADGFLRLNVPL